MFLQNSLFQFFYRIQNIIKFYNFLANVNIKS